MCTVVMEFAYEGEEHGDHVFLNTHTGTRFYVIYRDGCWFDADTEVAVSPGLARRFDRLYHNPV